MAATQWDTARRTRPPGAMIPDHVPSMEGDTDWSHRARGWTVSYLRGLLEALDAERGL